jgi:hypothetical protein
MPTSLGSGTRAPALTRDELVSTSDVTRLIENAVTTLEQRLQRFINARMPESPKAPVVNVAAASPASVNVAAPTVTVEPYIEASIPGFDVMAKEIAGLRADVKALTTILMKPTVRTVTRDGDGRITSITDRRA